MSAIGRGRARVVDAEVEWRKRVNPAFVDYWVAMKESRSVRWVTDNRTATRQASECLKLASKASRALEKERKKVRRLKSAAIQQILLAPLDGEKWPGTCPEGRACAVNPEGSAIFRLIVFMNYGITFRELINDLETNPQIYPRLLKVHRDFYRMRTGKRNIHDMKLKFGLDHLSILIEGLDFGLSRLNEWELAACLDSICPCEELHSPEYLRKVRQRLQRKVQSLMG